MPQTRELPNPSFIALRIEDRTRVEAIGKAITDQLEDLTGYPLTALGDDEYALSRPSAKELLLDRTGDELEAWLGGLDGVSRTRRIKADELVPKVATTSLEIDTGRDDDPISRPWHHRRIRLREAWSRFPGGLRSATWRDVRIGHIDTGYTRHEAFGPWQNGRSPSIRPHEGIDFLDGGLPIDPLDYEDQGQPGHGTRICSLIAGYKPGRFFGVAPQVSIIPYRITKCVVVNFAGNAVKLGEAIDHAVVDGGCQVINISLGDPCAPTRPSGRAIDKAYEAGVIVVAAAGNITAETTYPGRHARTITAGGIARDGRPWSGAARGRRVDLCAPADEITCASTDLRNGAIHFTYRNKSDGTSYATAQITGAAALWLAFHRNSLAQYPGWRLVECFRAAVRGSARRPAGWNDRLYGAGILDVAALLDFPLPPPGSLAKIDDLAEDDQV